MDDQAAFPFFSFECVAFLGYKIYDTVNNIHKFFMCTYQKALIVQHCKHNTIKTNNYVHISCTRTEKGERYITITPNSDIID